VRGRVVRSGGGRGVVGLAVADGYRVGGGGGVAVRRVHAVARFPDPTVQNGSVGFSITAGDGVDQNSPQYQSARQACSSLRGGGTANSGSGNLAKELKFAQCMRSHGVPDFPDPNKNGGFSGTSTINPASPTFQNAQSTCMQLSGLGGPGSSS
jgi:hypothetical protein